MSWLMFLSCALAEGPVHRVDQEPGSAAQVERGREVWAQCASCHGAEGEGRLGVAPRLNSQNFLSIVSNGFLVRGALDEVHTATYEMKLERSHIDDAVAVIRSWQTQDGKVLDESPLKGDPDRGERLFAERCQACHAQGATGYLANQIGLAIGRRSYLDRVTNGMLRAFITGGKDMTPMHGYVDPEAAVGVEVDSVIAYLRQEPW